MENGEYLFIVNNSDLLVHVKRTFGLLGIKPDLGKMFIGQGVNGFAYLYDGKVYKFTNDKTEALIGVKLKKLNTKYLNKIYDVRVLRHPEYAEWDEDSVQDSYLIIQDYLSPYQHDYENDYTSKVWEIFRREQNSMKRGNFKPFYKRIDSWNMPKDSLELADALINIAKELIKFKIRSWDIHGDNLGYKDGVLKYMDIGYGQMGKNRKFGKNYILPGDPNLFEIRSLVRRNLNIKNKNETI